MSTPGQQPQDIDIDAAELDLEAPVEPTATSDDAEYIEQGESLGGTGGGNAGGAG